MRRWGSVLIAAGLGAGCGAGAPPVEGPTLVEGAGTTVEYPEALWERGVTGETVLRVHVTPTGEVDSVVVEVPSGHAEFDAAARAGAMSLRFEPARQAGQATDAWVRLPIRFDRDSAGVRAARVGP